MGLKLKKKQIPASSQKSNKPKSIKHAIIVIGNFCVHILAVAAVWFFPHFVNFTFLHFSCWENGTKWQPRLCFKSACVRVCTRVLFHFYLNLCLSFIGLVWHIKLKKLHKSAGVTERMRSSMVNSLKCAAAQRCKLLKVLFACKLMIDYEALIWKHNELGKNCHAWKQNDDKTKTDRQQKR